LHAKGGLTASLLAKTEPCCILILNEYHSNLDRDICGFSAAPRFGVFPEKMLEYGARPFAIGQAKAIMAYFVIS
jgi:hypothetical protein